MDAKIRLEGRRHSLLYGKYGHHLILLWSAFILGLAGGLHCLGMCGPLAMSVPLGGQSKFHQALQFSAYHLSRIMAYAILGVIPGLFGVGLKITMAQKWISIWIGVFFMSAAVLLILRRFHLTLPYLKQWTTSIYNLFHRYIRSDSKFYVPILGFLNGLIPCGMVYMALAAALGNGTVWGSMVYMMTFGFGTWPVFILLAIIKQKGMFSWRTGLNQLVPYAILLMGIIFLWRGIGVVVPMDLSVLKEMGWSVLCH